MWSVEWGALSVEWGVGSRECAKPASVQAFSGPDVPQQKSLQNSINLAAKFEITTEKGQKPADLHLLSFKARHELKKDVKLQAFVLSLSNARSARTGGIV
ncbi:hypothetical protein [Cohnella sp. 56]|uniref:hypothetical protein n=1 Tax=Cohnella sp. 56 TaxID=3113722 RepID=UPI0030EAF084